MATVNQLKQLGREMLNALAVEKGVEAPESMPNITAVAEAVAPNVTDEEYAALLKQKADAAPQTDEAKAAPAKAKSWKIKTPVKEFTGVSRGVAFVNGVGETDDEWFMQRCLEAGYEVTEA